MSGSKKGFTTLGSSNLIYRGFGDPEPLDFLEETLDNFENPPYSMGLEFVQRALESVLPGGKTAIYATEYYIINLNSNI